AGSDPMKTGLAAMKFGTTLLLVPFSFVYVPEILLYGSAADIAFATLNFAFGYVALAITIQGTEFVAGRIAPWRRGLFLAAAVFFLLPLSVWYTVLGFGLMAAGWAPTFLARRAAQA
ncbi:MAG TPA: C4-dicarboxylate ABC transporter permease, partial [Kiloniellales bacterium]|nr:C4-dicarboxylate ABC transporter permease [Kiloniellales bacterium]